MPERKRKLPKDLTNENIAKVVFPKKVRDELYRIAHKDDNPDETSKENQGENSSHSDDNTQ